MPKLEKFEFVLIRDLALLVYFLWIGVRANSTCLLICPFFEAKRILLVRMLGDCWWIGDVPEMNVGVFSA